MADKKADQYYTRPPKLGKWEGFRQFVWNPETSQFLGRTGSSWAKILLFYVIFYAALVGFFAAMLAVFYQTLDDTTPKWQMEKGLIGNNPGLGFRPMPPEANVESTLIWYKASDKGNIQYWQNELKTFLATYVHQTDQSDNIQDCENMNKPSDGKVCEFKLAKNFAPCLEEFGYGYGSDDGGPCIFLKLNKIFGWEPEYYNSTTAAHTEMPHYLKDRIQQEEKTGNHHIVWVDCVGENPADNENIGPISYHPHRGFHQKYFPFKNIKGYVSPLVAVHFEKPARGVLINIECKAWARNIVHDRVDRRGSVHFELMVD